VGDGNWISFTTNSTLPLGSVFSLTNPVTGLSNFSMDFMNPLHGARGNLTPSLHLNNLSPSSRSTQRNAACHVDASNLFTDPKGHFDEWDSGETATPCDILHDLRTP
jgi:hypothetical protein